MVFKEVHWLVPWSVWGLCLLGLPDKSPYDKTKKKCCDVMFNGTKPKKTMHEYLTGVSEYTLEGLQKLMEFKEKQYIFGNQGPLSFDYPFESEKDPVEDDPMNLEENGGKDQTLNQLIFP